jgi:hypothetical protein
MLQERGQDSWRDRRRASWKDKSNIFTWIMYIQSIWQFRIRYPQKGAPATDLTRSHDAVPLHLRMVEGDHSPHRWSGLAAIQIEKGPQSMHGLWSRWSGWLFLMIATVFCVFRLPLPQHCKSQQLRICTGILYETPHSLNHSTGTASSNKVYYSEDRVVSDGRRRLVS